MANTWGSKHTTSNPGFQTAVLTLKIHLCVQYYFEVTQSKRRFTRAVFAPNQVDPQPGYAGLDRQPEGRNRARPGFPTSSRPDLTQNKLLFSFADLRCVFVFVFVFSFFVINCQCFFCLVGGQRGYETACDHEPGAECDSLPLGRRAHAVRPPSPPTCTLHNQDMLLITHYIIRTLCI